MAIAYSDGIQQTDLVATIQTVSKNFTGVLNGYLTVLVRTNSARTISTVTWHGVSMTLLNTPAAIGGSKFWVWGLAAPDTGALYDCVVTPDSLAYCETMVLLWSGTKQTGQADAVNDTGGSGSGTSHSGSITTVADNSVAIMFHGDGNNSDSTAGANTTLAISGNNINTGSVAAFYSPAVTPAGSATLNCNFNSAAYNYILFSISPATGGGVAAAVQPTLLTLGVG